MPQQDKRVRFPRADNLGYLAVDELGGECVVLPPHVSVSHQQSYHIVVEKYEDSRLDLILVAHLNQAHIHTADAERVSASLFVVEGVAVVGLDRSLRLGEVAPGFLFADPGINVTD